MKRDHLRARVLNDRLELGIGIGPELGEATVMVDGADGVAELLVQRADALERPRG